MRDKVIFESNPSSAQNIFYRMFVDSMKIAKPSRFVVGIDWAKDSGNNRGDIFKRKNNVVHVRFKTVKVKSPNGITNDRE